MHGWEKACLCVTAELCLAGAILSFARRWARPGGLSSCCSLMRNVGFVCVRSAHPIETHCKGGLFYFLELLIPLSLDNWGSFSNAAKSHLHPHNQRSRKQPQISGEWMTSVLHSAGRWHAATALFSQQMLLWVGNFGSKFWNKGMAEGFSVSILLLEHHNFSLNLPLSFWRGGGSLTNSLSISHTTCMRAFLSVGCREGS